MLAAKIEFGKRELDQSQWRYLLTGPGGDFKVRENPTNWISDSSWPDIYSQFHGMTEIEKLKGVYDHFMEKTDDFKNIFDSKKPH